MKEEKKSLENYVKSYVKFFAKVNALFLSYSLIGNTFLHSVVNASPSAKDNDVVITAHSEDSEPIANFNTIYVNATNGNITYYPKTGSFIGTFTSSDGAAYSDSTVQKGFVKELEKISRGVDIIAFGNRDASLIAHGIYSIKKRSDGTYYFERTTVSEKLIYSDTEASKPEKKQSTQKEQYAHETTVKKPKPEIAHRPKQAVTSIIKPQVAPDRQNTVYDKPISAEKKETAEEKPKLPRYIMLTDKTETVPMIREIKPSAHQLAQLTPSPKIKEPKLVIPKLEITASARTDSLEGIVGENQIARINERIAQDFEKKSNYTVPILVASFLTGITLAAILSNDGEESKPVKNNTRTGIK
ncbi:hypothetical protein HYX18_04510 [Candidatus Woesearchaeota archaeon]|nr:hypothetical protein [Candidatus Woesearchaeota archaeon]